MRAKKDVILREIAGEHILVPVGGNAADFMGIMTLNDSGMFLWELLLRQDCTEEMLVQALLDEYEVERPTAAADVRALLEMLQNVRLLE